RKVRAPVAGRVSPKGRVGRVEAGPFRVEEREYVGCIAEVGVLTELDDRGVRVEVMRRHGRQDLLRFVAVVDGTGAAPAPIGESERLGEVLVAVGCLP